jgi:hypothetical protein
MRIAAILILSVANRRMSEYYRAALMNRNTLEGIPVKPLRNLVLGLGLAVATSFFLAGCGPGDHAGHDHDHDHDHDHAGHDHHDASTAGDALGTAAGSVSNAAALVIIEKPTAEQLAAAKPYPLDTCLVAGEKLGEMGEPMVLVVGNQQVKLCCDACLPDLKENPAKFLAKLNP